MKLTYRDREFLILLVERYSFNLFLLPTLVDSDGFSLVDCSRVLKKLKNNKEREVEKKDN